MAWKVQYSNTAKDDILRLAVPVQRRIVKKIGWYAESEDPLSFATPLSGDLKGWHRFRIGDYRVIVGIDHGAVCILYVHRIGHRREIYSS